MMLTLITIGSLLAAVPQVAGHGGGMYYTIDGVKYTGAFPAVRNNETGSIQRDWLWHGIDTIEDPYLACGNPGTPLEISHHASMEAGSTITVDYHRAPEDPWTFGHIIGPMTAYLARCPDDGCENVDLSAKIWFKIWEAGLLDGTWLHGHWAMRDLSEGANLEIATPATLRPGKYILRHDVINLETGPVQLFPNCIHLEISGNGDALPSDELLVSFPGGYNKDQGFGLPPKGANGFDWLHDDNADETVYPVPGPAVWEG